MGRRRGRPGGETDVVATSEAVPAAPAPHAPVGGSPQQEHAFISTVLDTIGSLVIVLDRDGRIVLFNRACEALTGYTSDELLGRVFWEVLVLPRELAGVREVFSRLTAGQFPNQHENFWICRTGELRLVAWSNTALVNEAGDVAYVIGTGLDITEQREAEERKQGLIREQAARAEAEAAARRIHETLESITDGFFAVDHEWRLTYLNGEAERLMRRRREEVLGRDVWDVLRNAAGSRFFYACHRALTEGITCQVEEYYAATHRWFDSRIYPSSNGLSVFFQEVTQRKRTEDAQRCLVEAGNLLSASLDHEATLKSVARLVGRSMADICIVDIVEPSGEARRLEVAAARPEQAEVAARLARYPLRGRTRHLVLKALRTARSQLMPHVEEDYVRSIAQGPEHLELLLSLDIRSLMVVPLLARGRILGALSFLRSEGAAPYDAQDLLLAEEIARRAAAAIDNARLYREAQQAVLARDEVLAVVSHDLGNALQGIIMGANMLAGAVDAEGKAPYYVEAIRRSADRMERLIHDLLELHRLEARQFSIERRPAGLLPLLHEACQVLAPLAYAKSIELVVLPEIGVVPEFPLDAGRILQVLSNLIGNAIKFTPENGRVTVAVEPLGEVVRVWVRDNGPGIPEDMKPHVFDRFWQARRTRRKGIGLGLAIAKGIVDAHGGRIGVDSEEGKGSAFWFTLPRAAELPRSTPVAQVLGRPSAPESAPRAPDEDPAGAQSGASPATSGRGPR